MDIDFDDIDFSEDVAAGAGDNAWAGAGDIEQQLIDLENMWLLAPPSAPPRTIMDQLQRIYHWDETHYSPADAAHIFEEASQTVCQLYAMVSEFEPLAMPRITRLVRCIQESYHSLVALAGWSGHDTAPAMMASDMILRFQAATIDKDKDIQIVYQFILEWCRRLELRHKDEIVYKQITVNGRKTHAWVPARNDADKKNGYETVEKLCHFICQKSKNMDIWKKWISITSKSVYDKLQNCMESEFPPLYTTRSWIAFKDGLYCVYHDLFIYYDDPRVNLPQDLAVCAYQNVNFAPCFLSERRIGPEIPRCLPIINPLRDLHTPSFDTIMSTQHLCRHTQFWLMALMGRCLHRAQAFDTWQVVLYIKGRAGTGKSTIISLLSSVYDEQDVANISNNTEATFGLMGLTPDKLLWVAPEVKVDFTLDQAQFQSLVSNEKLSIPRKNMKPWEGIIFAHGAMAGNTLPSRWLDNAGSIRRRLFVINFAYKVTKTQGNMLSQLKTVELPAIIRKIVWCYRHAVVLVGERDLWSSGLLSEHIVMENNALYQSTNPLRQFLDAKVVRIKLKTANNAPFNWCPLTEFKNLFRVFCTENTLKSVPWSHDFYSAVFADLGLEVRSALYKWGEDDPKTSYIVVGCCPNDDLKKMVTIEGQDNPVIDNADTALEDAYTVTQEQYDAGPDY